MQDGNPGQDQPNRGTARAGARRQSEQVLFKDPSKEKLDIRRAESNKKSVCLLGPCSSLGCFVGKPQFRPTCCLPLELTQVEKSRNSPTPNFSSQRRAPALQASKKESKQASKPARKRASKQTKPTNQQASKQANKQTNQQASKPTKKALNPETTGRAGHSHRPVTAPSPPQPGGQPPAKTRPRDVPDPRCPVGLVSTGLPMFSP